MLAQSSRYRERRDYDLIEDRKLEVSFSGATTLQRRYENTNRQWIVEEWTRMRRLGNGAFGTIWLEEYTQASKLRAVKEIKKDNKDFYLNEIGAIAKFSKFQPYFPEFFGWYEKQGSIHLAMEFFELGDLNTVVGTPLPEHETKMIMEQVLNGVRILHSQKFTHRDLKPQNIFLASSGPRWIVKLGDFGIAARAYSDTLMQTIQGTIFYMAPEVLHVLDDDDDDYDEGAFDYYTNAVDLWSVGCIMFQLLTGDVPFKGPGLKRYCKGKLQFPYTALESQDVSEQCIALAQKLLEIVPKQRPTADEALAVPWFQTSESCVGEVPSDTFTASHMTESNLPIRRKEKGSTSSARSLSPPFLSLKPSKEGQRRGVSDTQSLPNYSMAAPQELNLEQPWLMLSQSQPAPVERDEQFHTGLTNLHDRGANSDIRASYEDSGINLVLSNDHHSEENTYDLRIPTRTSPAEKDRNYIGPSPGVLPRSSGWSKTTASSASDDRGLVEASDQAENTTPLDLPRSGPNANVSPGATESYFTAAEDELRGVDSLRPNPGKSGAASNDSNVQNDDETRALEIRNQMAHFDSLQARFKDEDKRKKDRAYLMAVAEKRVRDQMSALDQQIFNETGRPPPSFVAEWEAKARTRALRSYPLEASNTPLRTGRVQEMRDHGVPPGQSSRKENLRRTPLQNETPIQVTPDKSAKPSSGVAHPSTQETSDGSKRARILDVYHSDGLLREWLLKRKMDVERLIDDDQCLTSAFLFSAYRGTESSALVFLNYVNDLNTRDGLGDPAITFAARSRKSTLVRALLAKGAEANMSSKNKVTALHYTAFLGDYELTRDLLAKGARVNIGDVDVDTPLQCAVGIQPDELFAKSDYRANLEVVRILLEHGADVNHRSSNGSTPLMCAAAWSNLQVVMLLLEHGADPDLKTMDGDRASYWANTNGNLDIVEYLRTKETTKPSLLKRVFR